MSCRLVLAICVLLSLTACNLQQDVGSRSDAGGRSSSAPPLSGPTTDGGQLTKSVTSGKVVALDFWGSWCGPCRAEQDDLNTLVTTYAQRGVLFLGVDMRDDTASANAYRSHYHVAYQSLFDGSGDIAAAYDVSAPPTFIVIDRNGQIVTRLLGTLTGSTDALKRAIG